MPSHYSIGLILIASFFPGQAASGQGNDFLERKVTVNQKSSSAQAITVLLAQVNAPGGIISIYDRCSKPLDHQFSIQGATLQQGLNYISTIDGSRTWINRNGVILVGSNAANRTILNTIISDVDINPTDALSLSTQRLLESGEVREAEKKLGLVEMSSNLGFSSVSSKPEVTNGPSAQLPQKHFHRITVRDALNVLSSIRGVAVWHYEQFSCDVSTYRLSWVLSTR